MSWTQDALAPSVIHERGKIEDLRGKAVDGIVDLCRRQPAQCLADAAKLSALIAAGAGRETTDQAMQPGETTASAGPPMPVPDPRRRMRDARLTRPP